MDNPLIKCGPVYAFYLRAPDSPRFLETPTLLLSRERVYHFVMDRIGDNNPFYLTTVLIGAGGGEIRAGVQGSRAAGSVCVCHHGSLVSKICFNFGVLFAGLDLWFLNLVSTRPTLYFTVQARTLVWAA